MDYTVKAAKLNGRAEPSTHAKINNVAEQGETITGTEHAGWVAADDGSYYKIEYLQAAGRTDQDQLEPGNDQDVLPASPATAPGDDE